MKYCYSEVYKLLIQEGHTRSHAYAIINYAENGWSGLNKRNRAGLMRCRKGPEPDTCPGCGRPGNLLMCSLSGKYLEDEKDWDYRCMSCRNLAAIGKHPGTSRRSTRNKRVESVKLLEQIIVERPDIDIVQVLRAILS